MLTKVFISLFALFPLLFPLELMSIVPSTSKFPKDTIRVSLHFGGIINCSGFGICVVNEDFKTGLSDGFGVAKIWVSRSGSVESILFLRESLTKNTIEKHFSGSQFLMEEAYKGKLKLGDKTSNILIPAGKFRIKNTKEGFLLDVSG